MKILAFDQSTQKTGWAVFENGALLRSGVFDFHKEKDISKSSYEFWTRAHSLVADEQPDMIAAEGVSLQNPNVKTIVELARVQGMIQAASYTDDRQIPIEFYMPATWRKVVGIQTGRGIKRTELKKAAIELVSLIYDKQVTDDEADAILIGRAMTVLTADNKES